MTVHKCLSPHQTKQLKQRKREQQERNQKILTILHNHLPRLEVFPVQSQAGRTTRSKSKKTSDSKKSTSNDVQRTANSASAQDGFSCHICQKMFRNYDELKIHKVKCTKNPKKHFCEVCGKGFHARMLMQQALPFQTHQQTQKNCMH